MILDMDYNEVQDYVASLGEKPFRAKQLFEACLQLKDLDEISNLPKGFKEKIKTEYFSYEIVAHLKSKRSFEI